MPAPSLKLVSSVIGVGGVATGAGYGIYQVTKSPEQNKPVSNTITTKSISELLDETTKGKKITKEKKTDPTVVARWKQYINDNKTGSNLNAQDKLGITDWTSVKSKPETVPDTFFDACEKRLTVQVRDNQDPKFTNYVKWCTTA